MNSFEIISTEEDLIQTMSEYLLDRNKDIVQLLILVKYVFESNLKNEKRKNMKFIKKYWKKTRCEVYFRSKIV